MKVLHVGEYVKGGVATYIRMLLKINQAYHVENFLILADGKSEKIWNLDEDHIKYYQYKRNPFYIFNAIQSIAKYIDQIRPDVIYCHSTWAGAFVRLPLIFKTKKICIIYNAHGWAFLRDTQTWKKKIYVNIEKLLSQYTDVIINVSQYEYKAALENGISKRKNVVIYSGVEDEKRVLKNNKRNNDLRINILYVGRFDPQKGVDILLESFQRCSRGDIHLTMIGDDVISCGGKDIKKTQNNVEFLGWRNSTEVADSYEVCDVVVMPSRWEAFGLVAVEAMMHSKPVIVSDRGALPELVKDGENGWVFSLDDKNGLVNILYDLEKNKITQYGINARKIYEKKFTLEKMLTSTLNVYGQCKEE